MGTSNVLCKYFMSGACAFGDQCRFSHDKRDEPSQVCRFYLQGNCSFGERCRYVHSKPGWSARGQPAPASAYRPPPLPRAAGGGPQLPGGADELGLSEGAPNWEEFMSPDEMDEFELWQNEQAMAAAAGGGGGAGGDEGDILDPADIPLCPEYAASGACSAGDECCYIHGDQCETCKQHVLHPTDAAAAAEHATSCAALAAKLAKRLRAKEIECCICMEQVLRKGELSARRFGLMACEHAFCLGCIRSWRATEGVDVKMAGRTCPVCRTPTHFIVPSTTWPDSPAEKEEIVSAYKAALAQRDCALFDYGDGSCPFGTSCMYRHAYRDGRLEEVHLRRAGTADGGIKVIQPVSLSSFLEASLVAQRALSGAGSSSSAAAAAAAARRRAAATAAASSGARSGAGAPAGGGVAQAGLGGGGDAQQLAQQLGAQRLGDPS